MAEPFDFVQDPEKRANLQKMQTLWSEAIRSDGDKRFPVMFNYAGELEQLIATLRAQLESVKNSARVEASSAQIHYESRQRLEKALEAAQARIADLERKMESK